MKLSDLTAIFEINRDRYITEWKELLEFPSVSTADEHENDCTHCAIWLSEHLKAIGFESRLIETATKPIVFAERKGLKDKPVILYYGHYDVQPVDPVEKWSTPPFVPTLKDGRLYARGAQDNKGQLFYVIKALETLIANHALENTVKIIIEGEEESGSQAISAGLPQWRDMLQADILLVTDTGTVHSGAPTIIMGLRGLIGMTITLTGSTHDLHSGMHGGTAPNPAAEMARLIGSLHNSDGSIAVNNYYDKVRTPTDLEKKLAYAVDVDPEVYKLQTGVLPIGGELSFSPAERIGFRPSIDVNGIHSGYGGKGIKTIIPSTATAKITSRLVAEQDPHEALEQIISHIRKNAPAGLKLEISETASSGGGFRLDPGSSTAIKAKAVLTELSEMEPAFLWEGASIPIVHKLATVAGAEPLLVGFGSEEDNIHAPDESFSIAQFKLGYLYAARIICSL